MKSHERCLVLGGSGFIGTHLTCALSNNGNDVATYSRTDGDAGGSGPHSWIQGDFSDRASLARAIDGRDIVFHCISSSNPGSSNLDVVADLQSSVVNTLSVLNICVEAGTPKLVFLSSGGTVYGDTGQSLNSENCATDPVSAYGISKLMIEKYLYLYRRNYGLDYKIMRVSNPYGPGQLPYKGQGIIATILASIRDERLFTVYGDGSNIRDYLYIDDLVSLIIRSVSDASSNSLYNAGSGIGRSIKEVIDACEAAAGKKLLVEHRDQRLNDVKSNVLDITRAKQSLLWAPSVSWSDGLQATNQWLLSVR